VRCALPVAAASVVVVILGLGVGSALAVLIGRWRPPASGEVEQGGAVAATAESPRTPRRHRFIVPALTAIGFLLAYLQFGISWELLVACAFVAVMVTIATIDFYYMIIPNRIVLPAAAVGLAAAIALDPSRWWVYLAAALGSSFFLFVLALIWPGGMGMGDVKLALLMGGVLGATVVVAFFLGFLFGAVVGLALILSKRKGRKDAIPFGPYLALGSVLALLYGPRMLESYLGLLS
jgi:prepilin signal peptidase PulO-like enzyme (type II secretory pathway)